MHPAERELIITSETVDFMANQTTFAGFEKSWVDFLFRLERVWEICRRHAEASAPISQNWLSENASLRKKDPLLRYLKHARDSETHAVEPTTDSDMILSFQDTLSRPFRLDSIDCELNEGVLTIEIVTPDEQFEWNAEVIPGNPRLLDFKTRGTWYKAPHEHLGRPIQGIHPVSAAVMGLAFYKTAVSKLLVR